MLKVLIQNDNMLGLELELVDRFLRDLIMLLDLQKSYQSFTLLMQQKWITEFVNDLIEIYCCMQAKESEAQGST